MQRTINVMHQLLRSALAIFSSFSFALASPGRFNKSHVRCQKTCRQEQNGEQALVSPTMTERKQLWIDTRVVARIKEVGKKSCLRSHIDVCCVLCVAASKVTANKSETSPIVPLVSCVLSWLDASCDRSLVESTGQAASAVICPWY